MRKKNSGRASAYGPSDLLDEKEAAHYLNFAPATLRNWRVAGYGPKAIRIGKRARRYRFADLEAFITESSEDVA